MKRLALVSTALAALTLGIAPAAAQDGQPEASIECELFGCGDDVAGPGAAVEEEEVTPRSSATRGAGLAIDLPANNRRTNATQRNNRRNTTNRTTRTVRRVGRGDLRVQFATGSAQLSPNSLARVLELARVLQQPNRATRRIRIEGHTDSFGNYTRNVRLSQERAAAVAEVLFANGISSDRVEVRGFGPDQPLPGQNPWSPANRRVEAVVLN